MTAELMDTLVDHSAGNYRVLMIMGGELLAYGMAHEVAQLDEKCLPGGLSAEELPARAQEESEGVTMAITGEQLLPVVRVGEITRAEENAQRWLVNELWGASSVGVIGGAPKCAKTWLGLDMALSRGHRHGVPGQVRRAGAGSGPGLPGRGRAAGGARADRGNGPASRSRSRLESRST